MDRIHGKLASLSSLGPRRNPGSSLLPTSPAVSVSRSSAAASSPVACRLSEQYDDFIEQPEEGQVRVLVRSRPQGAGRAACELTVSPSLLRGRCALRLQYSRNSPGGSGQSDFSFNGYVSNENAGSLAEQASFLVSRATDGQNGAVVCYGITGAGKTQTLVGSSDGSSEGSIVHELVKGLFAAMAAKGASRVEYMVEASCLGVSTAADGAETLVDLLAEDGEEKPLDMRSDPAAQNAFICDGLLNVRLPSPSDLQKVLSTLRERWRKLEASGEFFASRTHTVLTVSIAILSRQPGLSERSVQKSRLHFVDLAGAEVSMSAGPAQGSGASLVFEALASMPAQTPREHAASEDEMVIPLMLRDCFTGGGKGRALLVANVWLDIKQADETLRTLSYAQQFLPFKRGGRQERSSVVAMKERHHDILKMLTEQADMQSSEESQDRTRLQSELSELSKRLKEKEIADKTLHEEKAAQHTKKIDDMRQEVTTAMSTELERIRNQSVQDMDQLRKAMEAHAARNEEEYEGRIAALQGDMAEVSRKLKASEDENADLRIRLAAAEERAKLLQDMQQEFSKDRHSFAHERKSLQSEKDQQWARLAAAESELGKVRTDLDMQRVEVSRLNAARAEDADHMRRENDSWKRREADLSQELTEQERAFKREREAWQRKEAELGREVASHKQGQETQKRETEMQKIKEESERREAMAQLQSRISQLEGEASLYVEQLAGEKRAREKLEQEKEVTQKREEELRQKSSDDLRRTQENLMRELEEAAARDAEVLQFFLEEPNFGTAASSVAGSPLADLRAY
eukprot:TRINITY_DN22298_c0_g2_i1.p1 TRINITY_DN22298_c0_g2~~TRINITY_DN22298_c0_g2_i1.p1  ORF type:complete len:803 (-),score=254.77 TRINITY_DN22298_c0_g2_i1:278-2686(-)